MIDPSLQPIPDGIRRQWEDTRRIRIDGFLQPNVAQAVLADLRQRPHRLALPDTPQLQFQMATHKHYPDATCDHAACNLVAWWFDEGLSWVNDLVGESFVSPPSGHLLSTLYTKGCYLDPHTDTNPGRAIAFVLGFTEEQWPHHEGGYLEFLRYTDADIEVTERRRPGFNTLDLFDIREHRMVHHIPVLTTHRERRALSGWFHEPAVHDHGPDNSQAT